MTIFMWVLLILFSLFTLFLLAFPELVKAVKRMVSKQFAAQRKASQAAENDH